MSANSGNLLLAIMSSLFVLDAWNISVIINRSGIQSVIFCAAIYCAAPSSTVWLASERPSFQTKTTSTYPRPWLSLASADHLGNPRQCARRLCERRLLPLSWIYRVDLGYFTDNDLDRTAQLGQNYIHATLESIHPMSKPVRHSSTSSISMR